MGTSRQVRRGAALATLVVASVLLPAAPASALVGLSSSLTMPSAVAVGQTGVAASVTAINTNSAPNQAQSNTLTQIRVALACGGTGSAGTPCTTPDPGVFAIGPTATGAAGTACAGVTFTVSAPDASGVVTFTPVSTVVLGPPAVPAGSDRCTVNFTFSVLKVPTIDVNPGTPGVQTNTHLLLQATSGGLTVTTQPSVVVTVVRGTLGLVTQASPSVLVGGVISDTATLTGPVGAAPTGSVTFRAYGPNDTTCTGPVFAQSTNPVANRIATSGPVLVTQPGVYRWVASYSGDANYLPAGPTACGDPAEAVTVRSRLRPPSDFEGDGKTDIAVFRPSNGGWYVHQSSGGDTAYRYGGQGDVPVPGDYDGDGRTDIAVFRPSTGAWFIHLSAGGDVALAYAAPGDVPLPLPAAIRTAFFP